MTVVARDRAGQHQEPRTSPKCISLPGYRPQIIWPYSAAFPELLAGSWISGGAVGLELMLVCDAGSDFAHYTIIPALQNISYYPFPLRKDLLHNIFIGLVNKLF